MLLERQNELGKISVSNTVFAKIVADSFGGVVGRAWPATKRGRLIGNEQKFNLSELESTLMAEETDEGLFLKFYIIVKFGCSIREITDILFDSIFSQVEKIYGTRPAQVTIIVTGVKSKQIARRETEVIRKNDFE